MRRLLTTALIENEWSEDEDESGWESDWIRFARNLGGLATPPPATDKEGRSNWIEEAVAAFARRHQLKAMLDLTFEEENRQ